MKKILLDADMLAYRVAFSSEVETKWDEDTWTLTCKESDMKREVKSFMSNLAETMQSQDIVPVFSTSTNYRYGIWPDYKANRKGKRKPLGLKWLIGWITETYKGISEPNIEADDLIGILATRAGDPADGYKGAKGVGIIGAKKLLDKDGYKWDTVLAAYEKAGQTEEDALLNARLAYILHDKDFNEETKEITLWTPVK